MKIIVTSVPVADQDTALAFYADVLGFIKKHDIPMGPFRWLTVVSPEDPEGVELLLEPMAHDFSKTYQKELFNAGVPVAAFGVADINAEYERLQKLGVIFKVPPTSMGPVTIAKFEDTCGNYIQIVQR